MHFDLNEQQQMIKETAREFAEKEIKPVAMARDRIVDPEEAFPVDLFKKSFELGFHKMFIPPEYGGMGLDCLTSAIIWEEIAAGDAGVCVSYQGHALAITQMVNAATEEQKETFLKAVTEGEGCLTALSFTEPNVGPCWLLVYPDYAMEATAVLEGDEYVLNGTKNFVTNGPMLFLRTRNGLQPGDSLLISGEKKTITLNINAISDSPLQTVEIVINSQIVKSFPIDGIQKKFDGSVKVEIESSSWICARCTDRDLLLNDKELTLYEGPPVKLNQKPSRLRFAHTSPIYLQMNGNHVVVQKSIKEGRGIIRAFKEFAEQNAAKEYQKMILEATRQADCILSSLNAD